MNSAEHAALRRAMQEYAVTQGEVECEHCGTQSVALHLVSPHRDKAFELVADEGYNMDFDPQYEKAVFSEPVQNAIIKKMFELGQTATLCKACGAKWMKLLRTFDKENQHGNT